MPHDVSQLLKMSQAELDALFTQSEAGPIPDGQAEGTAIVAPGRTPMPPASSSSAPRRMTRRQRWYSDTN